MPAGDYRIQNLGSGLYLGVSDDGKSLVQQPAVDNHQIWTLVPHGRDLSLINKANGLALQTVKGKTNNGDPLQFGPADGSLNQLWTPTSSPEAWTFVDAISDRVLDDYRQSKENGAPVVLYDGNGGANQQWGIESVKQH